MISGPCGRQFETILSLNKTRDEAGRFFLRGVPGDGALIFFV